MRIISIINQKGGCGKTTTAINLAGIMARKGYRTLLVDMDPQSHCAAGLAIPEQRIDLDIGDAMLAGPDQPIDPKRLLWRASRNLDLAPSRMKLAGLEASRGGLAEKPDKDRRLSSVLSRLSRNYDICFIDCSPSIGLLTFNALAAATDVLIPVETSFFSLQGATKQVNTIRTLGKRLGTQAPYWLVATLHDESSVLARDLLDELRRRFGKRVAGEVIRRDVTLKEAASFGQPVVEYAPTSTGAKDYSALAEWLLGVISLENDSRPREPEPVSATPEEFFSDEALAAEAPRIEVVGDLESKLAFGRKVTAADLGASAADAGEPHSPPEDAPTIRSIPATPPAVASTAAVLSVTRAEELAQRARVMLLKRADDQLRRVTGVAGAPASVAGPTLADPPLATPAPIQPAIVHPKNAVVREGTARSRTQAVRDLFGVRQTRSGMLFVQPLSIASRIEVACDSNGWKTIPMRRNEELGVYELCLTLPPGRRQYRLVIDGVWTADPFNGHSEPNPFGELNSVVDVEPADRAKSA